MRLHYLSQIMYVQKNPINTYVDVSSKDRGLFWLKKVSEYDQEVLS